MKRVLALLLAATLENTVIVHRALSEVESRAAGYLKRGVLDLGVDFDLGQAWAHSKANINYMSAGTWRSSPHVSGTGTDSCSLMYARRGPGQSD